MFYYGSWLKLPISTRVILAKHFGISKTGSIHVQDNVVVSDGYKVGDVEGALTREAIEAYVGSSEKDFDTLWKMMVDKAEGRIVEVTGSPLVISSTSGSLGTPLTISSTSGTSQKQTRATTKPKKKGK